MNNNKEDSDINQNCDVNSTPIPRKRRKQPPKPKIFECEYPECDQKFSIRWNMLNHIKQVHLKIRFKCDQCDYESGQKGTLVRHQLAVHSDGVRYLQCPHCPKTYKWETDFRRHLEKHTNVKFKCDECQKEFSEKRGLRHHIKVDHLNIKKKCDIEGCGFETTNVQSLNAHKVRKHAPEKLLKCKFCKYETPRMGDLKRHLKASHLKLKEYRCPHCDFLGSRKDNIKTHMKKQHIICEGCKYISHSKSDFKRHIEDCDKLEEEFDQLKEELDPLEEELEPFVFIDVEED